MAKMIALDLDGVLLGGTEKGYGIRPEALSALEKAVDKGLKIGIVTGRDFDFILQMFESHGVTPETVGYPHVIIAEERFVFYLENGRYKADDNWNRHIESEERNLLGPARAVIDPLLEGKLRELDPQVQLVDESVEERRGFLELIFSSVAAAQAGEKLLSTVCDDQALELLPIRNVRGICLRHRDAGKGTVLHRAARQLEIDSAEIVAVGDSENDRSMLNGNFGFTPATVVNGEPAIKDLVQSQGGYIATEGHGLGVAQIISKILSGFDEDQAEPRVV